MEFVTCHAVLIAILHNLQELQLAGINFKAFDLGGHEIARRVWKDFYAKVWCPEVFVAVIAAKLSVVFQI